ncbi:hypothetical protein Patl1_04415 [Pistacia atlantica]|uniref:Uncharacterized protein n=2 Tax=Pistacia atlantica TaxID=434234 RepID=A0ACC1BRT8_9ROSI|nr:hypothetical protein Patl1_13869 [Pistacia atlantica]KAJ0101808.1 hypothetical protein Patl1_04415 [Pistacia atlantica]
MRKTSLDNINKHITSLNTFLKHLSKEIKYLIRN